MELTTTTDIHTETTEIIDDDCHDCTETKVDLSALKAMTDHDLLVGILAELVMIRGTLTETMESVAAIGTVGIGGMFKGLFGGS